MNEDDLSSAVGQNMSYHTNFILLEYIKWDMESLNPEFALYGTQNKCAKTDTDFFSISEVCTMGVTFFFTKDLFTWEY